MHPIRSYIAGFVPISDTDWSRIEPHLERRVHPKETLLLEAGKRCRYLFFLESGLIRFFFWRDGLDITKFFTPAPQCLTAQKSFVEEIPAAEGIETLEESVVWWMPRAAAFELLELPAWSEFVRRLIQSVQFEVETILETIQTQTAEARYGQMLEANDPLLGRVPLRHLASYLGIAPQSLSRIRKKRTARRS